MNESDKSDQCKVDISDIDDNIIEIGDEIIFVGCVGHIIRLIKGIVINIDYNYIYIDPNPEYYHRDIIKLQTFLNNVKILNKSKRILNLDQLKCQ